MASSRLEKIGTIFSRVNALLKTGAMKWEDRPLWYDIYKAFPPKNEPKYDRPAPDIEVRNIFYKEDQLRAQYHKAVKPGVTNLSNNDYTTKTKRFIEAYNKLENTENLSKNELFESAILAVNQDMENRKLSRESEMETSLAGSFKEAQEQKHIKLDIGKIMKE